MNEETLLGIPQESLDRIKRDYQDIPLAQIPKSPMIPQEILDSIPRKFLDLQYANHNERCKLDIYLPPEASPENRVPCLIQIHGGGFVNGDKRDMSNTTFLGVINHGYAYVSVEYRPANKAEFPKPIHDCKAAIRWIKAHAGEYGIDPARIAVTGNSSGGNYSLLVATTNNLTFFEDKSMGNPGYDSSVQACIALYPVINSSSIIEERVMNGTSDGSPATMDAAECKYLGARIVDLDYAFVQKSNPGQYITPQICPIMLRQGMADKPVPYQQAVVFAEQVRQCAGEDRIDFALVEGAGHADPPFKQPIILEQALTFLNKYLKN
ncbi:putative uncharacterized protein [Cryptobacterium sp. CAG:338]|nr:putative uncharacterized protein [Cryptobacterium sp. CAG:338]